MRPGLCRASNNDGWLILDMSTSKILILFGLVVSLLYIVSLAVSAHNQGQTASTQSSWLAIIPSSSKINLAQVSAINGSLWAQATGTWTIPARANQAALMVADVSSNSFQLPIRKLTISNSFPVKLVFMPKPDPGSTGTFADPQAMAITNQLEASKECEIPVLKHGGTLSAVPVNPLRVTTLFLK